jgi:hypothetical protein
MWPHGPFFDAKNNVSPEEVGRVRPVIEQLGAAIDITAIRLGARRATIRARLPGSRYIVIDDRSVHVCGQPHYGMPHVVWHKKPGSITSLQQALDESKYDIGFPDPFGMSIPSSLTADDPAAPGIIHAIAVEYVQSEIRRQHTLQNVVHINPIFGKASYMVRDNSVFVLMPFNEEMNAIYDTKLKPCFEYELHLSIHRADELKNVNVVMQDIWKSICEARIVLAI